MATLLSAVPTLAFTVASAPAAHAQEAPPDCTIIPIDPSCFFPTTTTTQPPPTEPTTTTTATTTPPTEPTTTTTTTTPPTTATTEPPTTATTQRPTTTTERPTTSTTSRGQVGGTTNTTDPGTGSTGSTGGGGGRHTVVTTPPPNNGFWGVLAGLANSNRAVTRGKNAKLTLIAPVTPSSEAAKPKQSSKKEATATTEDSPTKVANAADPQALSLENTRAETHDRAMPRNIRIALIALAALVLVTLLLVPRVPAMLFTRGLDEDGYAKRRQKRRSVATISVGGPRPKG